MSILKSIRRVNRTARSENRCRRYSGRNRSGDLHGPAPGRVKFNDGFRSYYFGGWEVQGGDAEQTLQPERAPPNRPSTACVNTNREPQPNSGPCNLRGQFMTNS